MKFVHYLRIVRPLNLLIVFLIVVVSLAIAKVMPGFGTLFFIVLSLIFIAGGAYSMNDILDRDIDRIVHPSRPIPLGSLSTKEAWCLTLVLFSLSLISAVFINLKTGIICSIMLVLIFLYNRWLKGIPLIGNVVVSLTSAFTFIFVGLAIDNVSALIFPFIFAFLLHIAREVIKDMEDIEGDRMYNLRTIPIVWGKKVSVRIVKVALLLLISVTFIPYLMGLYDLWYLVIILGGFDLPLFYVLFILTEDIEKGETSRISNVIKMTIFPALLALLIGS